MGSRTRSWWGWGWADEAVEGPALEAVAAAVRARPGFSDIASPRAVRAAGEIELRAPRLSPPSSLAAMCSVDPEDRAGHTHGKSFRDIVRNIDGDLTSAPDVVVRPSSETDLAAVLDWCSDAGIAAIAYGGGSSVAGGVEGAVGEGYAGVASIDLGELSGVVEIDRMSRAARMLGGTFGPDVEDALRPLGLTLRHYPQSFEFSTVGGWLATRSGGHFATNWTHIDDFVESMRVLTPAGMCESRRLPGSGAGPSPDRMFLGSEGALGVITEAWLRVQDRPRFRATLSANFVSFSAGVAAARAIAMSGLHPSNCRLLDSGEAAQAGVRDGSTVLVIGFESADHPLDAWIERAAELVADHGGLVPDGVRTSVSDDEKTASSATGTAGAWRSSFLRAPYGRDAVVRLGCIAETFETAVTWDRFEVFHGAVTAAVRDVLDRVCGGGTISCRFTHVYPDGCAPYYTVLAPSRPGSQLAMWGEVKAAASEALLANGGTITHHHAVGRDHRPWYDRQRPDLFAAALTAAKGVLDPAGIMNPGVLLPGR